MILSILAILAIFAMLTLPYAIQKASAQTTYTLTVSRVGNGNIIVYNENTNQTYVNPTTVLVFNLSDQINVTAEPYANESVTNFICDGQNNPMGVGVGNSAWYGLNMNGNHSIQAIFTTNIPEYSTPLLMGIFTAVGTALAVVVRKKRNQDVF